jgi:hypothetical protein
MHACRKDTSAELVFLDGESPTAPHAPLIGDNFVVNGEGTDGADRVSADDIVTVPSGSVPFVDGAGLVRVPFQVAPGARGVFDVRIDLDDIEGTFIVDGDAVEQGFEAVDGTITVVSEPTSGIVQASALVCLLWLARRGRERTVGRAAHALCS